MTILPLHAIAILAPFNWLGFAGSLLCGLFEAYPTQRQVDYYPPIELFVFDEKELSDNGFTLHSPNKPGYGGKALPKFMKQVAAVRDFYRYCKSVHATLFVPTPYAGIIIPQLPAPSDLPLMQLMYESGQIVSWDKAYISQDALSYWATTLAEVATYGRS